MLMPFGEKLKYRYVYNFMEPKSQIFTYPESQLVYKEVDWVNAEVFLPEYVVNVIRERAEMLEADVSIRLWWPFTYIFIEKKLEEKINDCYDIAWSKTERDALNDCEEKCSDDEKCFDECIDAWKHSVYKGCLEDIGDEIRPSITKTTRELEHVFKLYGIEADIETEWNHDTVTIRALLKGYSEIIPMEIGQLLLTKIVDASMARSYKDRERLTYNLTSALYPHLTISRLIELYQNLDKDNIRITRTLDSYNDLRRYEMIIEDKDLKIALYVTEEKDGEYWTVTNIVLGYIQQSVIGLTSA
jgi:hypothetical protein